MSYEDIQWYENANIGFNSGNTSFSLPGAFTPNATHIDDYSNVGIPGLYVYRVDQNTVVEPNQTDRMQGSKLGNETQGSGMGNEVHGSGIELTFKNKSDCSEIENETIDPEASGVTRENITGITIALFKQLPILLGDYVTLTCSLVSDNSSNITYIWSLNGSLLSDTSPVIVIAGVQKHNLGQYECTITRGCYKYSTNINLYTSGKNANSL